MNTVFAKSFISGIYVTLNAACAERKWHRERRSSKTNVRGEAMINSAKEAREILAKLKDKSFEHFDQGFAKGYLAALQGPEVKALVEALEDHQMHWDEVFQMQRKDEKVIKALTQWDSLQGKEK